MPAHYDAIDIAPEGEERVTPPKRGAWKVAVGAALGLAAFAGVAAAVASHGNANTAPAATSALLQPASTQVASERYRLTFESPAGQSDIIQMSQLELFRLDGTTIPFTARTDAPLCDASQGPDKLVDGKSNTKMCLEATNAVITFTLPDESIVLGYRWMSANDNPQRDPSNWKLGEFKEGVWETQSQVFDYVHNRGAAMPRESWSREFSVAQEQDKTTYRFLVSKNAGVSDITQLGQLAFLDMQGSQPKFTATSTYPPCKKSQGAKNLYDGKSTTKFCTGTEGFSVLITFNEPVTLQSYRWMSADDNPERDPTSFELIEFDVPPPTGSHHTVSSKIDYIYKRGGTMNRMQWTEWFSLSDQPDFPLPGQ